MDEDIYKSKLLVPSRVKEKNIFIALPSRVKEINIFIALPNRVKEKIFFIPPPSQAIEKYKVFLLWCPAEG